MKNRQPDRFKTISEYHQFRGLPKPEHPLISVINYETIKQKRADESRSFVYDFYAISLKRGINAKMKYGQLEYDFDEGVMVFISPGQVLSIQAANKNEEIHHAGWLLLVHPDFLWNTPLAKTIHQHEYFSYAVHEALHLSEKEELMMAGIVQHIEQEYHANIDKFSQNIIITHLESLLSYAERFYHRQFITRKINNHQIMNRLEAALADYFKGDMVAKNGLPTVQYVADALNVSPNYLSGLLNLLTGQSTQQHIHDKIIEKAKEKLSTTDLSVSEIAYELGFEHPQSFSKLFKTKTKLSPLAFRLSFN